MAGHPTYHVDVIKLKWQIIWTGELPHLRGLPHLPGFPHLHVNRPFVPVQTSHFRCTNLMQMSDKNRFVSLALNSTHMKWDVWTGCKATLTRHRTNFRPAKETFTADTVYTGPFNFFGSVHTELWTVRRLNFRTKKVIPCERNTLTHEFSTGRKLVRCCVNDAQELEFFTMFTDLRITVDPGTERILNKSRCNRLILGRLLSFLAKVNSSI